jgi:hypothetical protein
MAFNAPATQFVHVPAFPDDPFEAVVSPNAETLSSSTWLDLAREPVVLSLPDTQGRDSLMPMLDAWTNVFTSPGARTTGTGKRDFAVVGPFWQGTVPAGVQEIRSPTNMVWIIGRTQTNGASDDDVVHSLQAQYRLTPLSAWGTAYTPPTDVPVDPNADVKTAPVDQVARMEPATFWTRRCELMKGNPPAAADAETVARFAAIGIVPGQALDLARLDAATVAALEAGARAGLARVEALGKTPPVEIKNTWAMADRFGSYGTDYRVRASVAWVGLSANLPDDAIYPLTRVDRTAQPLTGANRYVQHFAPDQILPVNAFWSLTMDNNRQFFVANPIGRYAIGDRDPLVFNADGSLDRYIQHDSPGIEKEVNWLPAPEDGFNLILRRYWPKPQVLDGSWVPPAVTKVS